ncbi:hypothetical protein C7K25_15055 [Gulosibacter molinativorax]|uniref:VWA domain-containing protein n=2 Tax=Gulosibacter molinativorax TaxID=256821 RepID=A0ABT7CDH0_9MICO|nr:hypothetical protein [Gulosibacter molinativorax]
MGHGGADPIDRRYDEARFALRSVARHCRTSKAMAAVWHFDQPTSGDSAILPLKQWRNLQAFEAALRVPTGSQGSSSLGPALKKATQLAKSMPSHEIRLTILSDFCLTDHNPAEIWARLEHFPGNVHAVVLGVDDPPRELHDLGITVSRIAPGDEPGVVAATLHHSLTEGRPGRQLAHRLLRISEPMSLETNSQ